MGRLLNKSYMIIAYFSICISLIIINIYHFCSNSIVISGFKFTIAIIGILLIIGFNKFIIKKLNEKSLNIVIILLTLIFLGLEIFSVRYFRVEPGWDFKWIMDKSWEVATTGHLQDPNYFKVFPNNIAAFVIVTIGMKLFNNSEIGAYVVNIIFVFISVVFCILNAKKIGGTKLALNVIILLVGCAPLYLYTPIVYTDTLSVAFPMITLFFILKFEEADKKSKKRYLYIGLVTVFSMIGYFIKPVAAIILVAFLIEKIIKEKKFIRFIPMMLIIFIIMTQFFNLGYERIVNDKRRNEQEYPLTHWIMMGLGLPFEEGGTSFAYGAYSQPDSDYTATSGNYEQKKEANIIKIKERLRNFGLQRLY